MACNVRLEQGRDGSHLYVPEIEQPRPAVLVLHGSDGGRAGWSHWQALAFASAGFIALAPNYSKGGNMWHAGDILNVDLDNTETQLNWLREHKLSAGRVGLCGASRGAEHALLLTSLLAQEPGSTPPDAVAAHSPSDTIVGAFIAGHFSPDNADIWDPSLRAWRWRGSSENLLPTQPIEIEHYVGALFISHGEKDSVWSVKCTHRLRNRLQAHGRQSEIHLYPNEDHGFSASGANTQKNKLIDFFTRHLL